MVRRMTLWMRGVSVGSIALVSAALTGCVVDAGDPLPDAEEAVDEADSPLNDTTLQGDPAEKPTQAPIDPSTLFDPQPDPWHEREQNDSPTDPDEIRQKITTTPSGGNHDAP
jgi:hypothetical protein